MKRNKPKTKLRIKKLIKGQKITELAKAMGIPYTQVYKYLEDDVNPTLLILERFAEGLSKIHGKKIGLIDLLEIKKK